jgi:gamma-glutamyltranspeptidase/glutathione hydrolase
VAAAYFYDAAGKPWPVGHVLKNPELAQVLRASPRGARPRCWRATVAQAIVDKVRSTPPTPAS